jgi:nicotinamidase-related amidase
VSGAVTLVVVIDAQRAFVDRRGSLAQAFGPDEIQPGVDALGRLQRFLVQRPPGTLVTFVRSEYWPGQFTGGRLEGPLAHVCVPGRGIDCEWAQGVDVSGCTAVVTKHQADAGETPRYREVVAQAIAAGVGRIVLTGFQLTTCVEASALSTRELVSDRSVQVIVAEDLCGARASSYTARPNEPARVELTRRALADAGIAVTSLLAPILLPDRA